MRGHHVLPEVDVRVGFQRPCARSGQRGGGRIWVRGDHIAGPFRAVEHSELNGAGIRDRTAFTAQGINLPEYLPFGNSAHCGIAAHGANGGEVHRDKQDFASHGGCSMGCFIAGVSCTDYNDVVSFKH